MAQTLTPVTDSELLKQLNSPDTPAVNPQQVTDPELLAKLNATDTPNPDGTTHITYRPNGTADLSAHPLPNPFAESSLTGAARGVIDLPGMLGDLANLAQLGYGKVTGDQGIQDKAHAGLKGENGFDMGTGSLDKIYDALGLFSKPTTPDTGDYSGGKLAGSFVGGAAIPNPGSLVSKAAPALARDAADAGVTLRSTALGNTYGAQNIVRGAQRQTQDELTNFGKGIIGDVPTTQAVGTGIAGNLEKVVQGATDSEKAAYDALGSVMPKGGAYDTSGIAQTYGNLSGQGVQNAALGKAIGDNPLLKRFADLFGKGSAPPLSFEDMDALRRTLGPMTRSADPDVRGVASQLYKATSEAQRNAAATVSGGGSALDDTIKAAKAKSDALDDLGTIESKNPEMLPNWLTQQANKGGTRLDAFANSMTPEQLDGLSRWLLNQKSTVDGGFNSGALSKYLGDPVTGLAPEARTALMGGTSLNDKLSQFGRIYDATKGGRDLLASPATAGPIANPLNTGVVGAALGHLVGAGHGDPGGIGAAIGGLAGTVPSTVLPLAAGAAAKITTNPAAADAVTGAFGAGNLIDRGANAAFPDVYSPPPQPEKHSDIEPGDVKHYIATADPKMVTQYIGQKLGPQVAKQFADAGDEGYSAALNAVLLNPQYRSTLLS